MMAIDLALSLLFITIQNYFGQYVNKITAATRTVSVPATKII